MNDSSLNRILLFNLAIATQQVFYKNSLAVVAQR